METNTTETTQTAEATQAPTESAPTMAPAPAKRQRRIDWKVDNLRHVADHGSAAEFADEAKAAAIAAAFNADGITRIEAGQSHILIKTLGHVTETRAYFSVGSHQKNALHYHDGALRFKFEEGTDADAYEHLKCVIFGDEANRTPLTFARQSGAAADTFRTWFNKYSFVFFGENGLRAKAIAAHTDRAKSQITGAAAMLKRAEHQAEYHAKRDYKSERQHILTAATDRAKYLQREAGHKEAIAEKVKSSASFDDFKGSYEIQRAVNFQQDYYPGKAIYFPGTPQQITPQPIRPNYTASVDGEKITLSSGLVCPFTYSRLIEFLKTGAPIRTNYGEVRKVETASADATTGHAPQTFLQCGCHVIDAAKINDELAELLIPTHEVIVTAGTPRLTLDPEGDAAALDNFRARCLAVLEAQTANLKTQRAQNISGLKTKLAAHATEAANHEKRAAEFEAETEKAREALEAAQIAEVQTRDRFAGADVETLEATAKLLVNALLPKEF